RASGGAEIGSSPPGGGEGWPKAGHTESGLYVADPVIDPRDASRRCVRVLRLIGWASITLSLGSMATGVSREWISTPANTKSTHGSLKRMRGDGITAFYHCFSYREASIDAENNASTTL